MGVLLGRVPAHRHLGYSYAVEIDEDMDNRKIMAHHAVKDGVVIHQCTYPTYHFMTLQQFIEFVAKMERATR
jgi:hypothetical protein